MITLGRLFRHNATRLVALAIILVLYGCTRLPELPTNERASLAARFGFARLPLAEVPGPTPRYVRNVHPSLQHISSWISAVGAAGASVALNDLDGDGLPNDVCSVEPRTDQVIVAPAPGTPARYEPFVLDPGPLLFDAVTTVPLGCVPGDLNEDGLIDILVYYGGRTPIAFLRKAEQESKLTTQSYVRRELVAGGGRWYSSSAVLADLDGDGHVDLIVSNYFPDGARILDPEAAGLEQLYASWARAYNGGSKHLLRWVGATAGAEPTVRFEEVGSVLDDEVAHGWTLATAACDLDGDLLPEIYLANDYGPDRLLHNRSKPGELSFARLEGKKGLTTPNSKVLGRDGFHSMGVDCGDLNGDGLLDLFVSNITVTNQLALEESHFVFVSNGELDRMSEGVAPYDERSEPLGLSRSGWAWDAKLDDFDNDGVFEAIQATGFIKGGVNRWPEVGEQAIGNPLLLPDPRTWPRFQPGDDMSGHEHLPFFVRAGDGRFYDLAREVGLGEPQLSRGMAIADVDGDGKQDFAVANLWEPSYLYRNASPAAGEFLGLHLLLSLSPKDAGSTRAWPGHPGADRPGRPAVGATATVQLPDGRRVTAQVDGGNGHTGRRSPNLHFGLGPRGGQTIPVDLQWRDTAGQLHRESLSLSPGWHTVVLDWSDEGRVQ
jgi:hypothetical protein